MKRAPETRTGRTRAQGERRMGANPHANGGILLRDLRMPDFRDYAPTCRRRGAWHRRTRVCSALSCGM